MQLGIYTIYDSAAKAYFAPFFLHSDPMAERQFRNMVNEPSNRLFLDPGDYTLYRIGTFHDDSAGIEPSDPVRIITGNEAYTHDVNPHNVVSPVQPGSSG